jgi:transcription initiation factor TFIIIB Brf1 subunit/transcription initiation factor TFIIB
MTCPNCGTDCDGDVCGDCGCFPVLRLMVAGGEWSKKI